MELAWLRVRIQGLESGECFGRGNLDFQATSITEASIESAANHLQDFESRIPKMVACTLLMNFKNLKPQTLNLGGSSFWTLPGVCCRDVSVLGCIGAYDQAYWCW